MTAVQLEYIVAVDTYRSFVTAAEKCFVTQPTLSMQIQKLEDELGVKLFDRSKLPVTTTEIGEEVIEQARIILKENARVREIIDNYKKEVQGTLRVGIIPTLAPYLLPPLVAQFTPKYPAVKLEVWEYNTEEICRQLKQERLDCGVLATPLEDAQLREQPLFYESFVVYTSPDHPLYRKKVVKASELTTRDVWLLNEGHCMRNQVLNLCREHNDKYGDRNLAYNTGSVETLKRMVEQNRGWTVLPELSITELENARLEMIRYFHSPEPVREISLVTHRHFIKQALIAAFREEVSAIIPEKMKTKSRKQVVQIQLG
ncbi:hydrogen peroxide-inducible genes activator [Compostibacter hankyongensis]|uniref:Hydrogen peroxide-inducible genes activator n=1 Tax=Compostibacter hankyongensis TaxID=1007089 RepID=A0ABP8FJD6_9BACT